MLATRVDRIRLLSAVVLLLAIPVGLFARSHRAGADPVTLSGFLSTYTGDTLWPVLFFFIGRWVFPLANRASLAAFTLALTLTIEFNQLWQPAILQSLRAQPVIGFLLGNKFIWSDVACLLVGTCVAVLLDTLLLRNDLSRAAA
jgi:hypothetical protein